MRILISMFIVLALVMTTSFPAMSHDTAKVEKAAASSEHGDCHKHAKVEQSGKTAQNDKDSCEGCDKGICKCVGGTCHSGLSKIFGNGSNSVFRLTSSTGSFNFTNDVVESALSNRLKRPPKA